MACSMRVDTVSPLRLDQFKQIETPEGDRWVCVVQAKDSTDREAKTRPRTVYIPNDIMDQVKQHVQEHNIGPEDHLFHCSTRTIQRDVERSAKNAATRTGNDDYEKVSCHDLRRYFATHLLFRHEVPPPVVRVLGGWKSDDAMFEYLVLPNDVLFERLGEVGLLGTSYDKLARHDHAEKIAATTTRLADLVAGADADVVEAAGAGVKTVFEDVEAITVDLEGETRTGPDEELPPDQISFQRFSNDEAGIASPAMAAKIAYCACVIFVSWSATFGSLA
jgi:hypothetical protein